MKLVDWFYCLREVASSVPKGCKSGFVTYRHHVMQQAKLQLVVKYCFWLVTFYPLKNVLDTLLVQGLLVYKTVCI